MSDPVSRLVERVMNPDQAQSLRDFVAQLQAQDSRQQALDEFDRLTTPVYGQHYRDKRGNITMDVKPDEKETAERYHTKLAFASVRTMLGGHNA